MSKRNFIFITSALLLNACMEHTIEESHDNCNNKCSENQTCQLNESGTYECKTNTLPDPCNNSCSENQSCQLNESGTYECKTNTLPDPCNNSCSENQSCLLNESGDYECKSNTLPDPCNNECSGNTTCYEVTAGTHTCLPDSDGDNKPDEIECCPYNREIIIRKDDATCSTTSCSTLDSDGTFHIYHAENLLDLYRYTSDNINNKNVNLTNVVLERDIDLSDLTEHDESGNCRISRSNTSSLHGVSINGNGHAIISSICPLAQSLFDLLDDCSVSNIKLNYKVIESQNTTARALLADRVIFSQDKKMNQYKNIIYEGEIKSSSELPVGGLVAEVSIEPSPDIPFEEPVSPYSIFKFENCIANGISIQAESASSVGGLIGKGEYINLSMTNADSVFIINDIEGKNYVGGIIGSYCSKDDNINYDKCKTIPSQDKNTQGENTYFRIIFNSIKGQQRIGGFVSSGASTSNIIMVGNTITGDSYIGGIRGDTSSRIEDNNAYLALSINSITGTGNYGLVGGIIGNTFSLNTIFTNILTYIYKIEGVQFVGGIAGQFLINQPTPPATINFDSVTNNINIIKGGGYVNGIILYLNMDKNTTKYPFKSSFNNISNFINKIETTSNAQNINQILFSGNKDNIAYTINGMFGIRQSFPSIIRLSNASVASARLISNRTYEDEDNFSSTNYLIKQALGTIDKKYFNNGCDYIENTSCPEEVNEPLTKLNKSIYYLSTAMNNGNGEYPLNRPSDEVININKITINSPVSTDWKSNLEISSACNECKWELRSFQPENSDRSYQLPYLYQKELEDELSNLKKIHCTTFGNNSQFCNN